MSLHLHTTFYSLFTEGRHSSTSLCLRSIARWVSTSSIPKERHVRFSSGHSRSSTLTIVIHRQTAQTIFTRLHYDANTDTSVLHCRPLTGRCTLSTHCNSTLFRSLNHLVTSPSNPRTSSIPRPPNCQRPNLLRNQNMGESQSFIHPFLPSTPPSITGSPPSTFSVSPPSTFSSNATFDDEGSTAETSFSWDGYQGSMDRVFGERESCSGLGALVVWNWGGGAGAERSSEGLMSIPPLPRLGPYVRD